MFFLRGGVRRESVADRSMKSSCPPLQACFSFCNEHLRLLAVGCGGWFVVAVVSCGALLSLQGGSCSISTMTPPTPRAPLPTHQFIRLRGIRGLVHGLCSRERVTPCEILSRFARESRERSLFIPYRSSFLTLRPAIGTSQDTLLPCKIAVI